MSARPALFFLAPWLIGLVVFTIGPVLATLFLSFTDYRVLSPPRWVVTVIAIGLGPPETATWAE